MGEPTPTRMRAHRANARIPGRARPDIRFDGSPASQTATIPAGSRCSVRLMATTAAGHPASGSGLERFFAIRARGSTVRTEVLGGVVTFLTMAYIVFVNPAILSA